MPSIAEYLPGIKEGVVTFDNIPIADLGDILDANKNEILELDTTTSAVNNFRIANAAASSGPTLSAVGDDTNISINLTPKGTGGTILNTSGATTTTALDVVASGLTTGKGLDLSDANALTSGIGIHLASSATAITGAGRLLYSNHTGATGTSAILNEFASAATDETVIAKVTASAALALGTALQVSGAAVTTGTLLSVPDADALTTGGVATFVSNSADTGTRSIVQIKQDHASASGATALEVWQDGALAAIKLTGNPTIGIDFTALANTEAIFNCTAATGSTAAPQTNAAVGFVKIKVAGTDQWIPYYNAT